MTSLNDYSKWRNFGDDDSDDERPRGMPRVTRLDGTQSITIGPPPATRTATSVRADEVNAKPAGSKRPADALDYSRWDQLQVDDSDGDDDDNEYDGYGNVIPKHLLTPKGDAGDDFAAHAAKYGAEPYRGPYHGPENAEGDGDEEEALTAEEMATLRARVAAQTAEREAAKPPPPTPEETAAALAEAAAARRAALTAKLTRNGAARETHLWRQARAIRRAIRRNSPQCRTRVQSADASPAPRRGRRSAKSSSRCSSRRAPRGASSSRDCSTPTSAPARKRRRSASSGRRRRAVAAAARRRRRCSSRRSSRTRWRSRRRATISAMRSTGRSAIMKLAWAAAGCSA